MTRRERLRRCYWYEELDRPGVYSRTGFPRNDPTYDRIKAYLGEHSELKGGWGTRSVETSHYDIETRMEPVSEAWERHVSTLHTPAGDLVSARRVSLKGQPGLQEKSYINSREDAETYLSLPMPTLGGEVSPFFEAVEQMGDRGIVEVGLGLNPGGYAAVLCGSESFAMMSLTDRDILHALCEREMNIVINRLKYALARGVGPYFNMLGEEYIAPPLHSPKDFNDFNVRYNKPIFDVVHEAGGRVHTHCHGSIKKVFQGFLDMGTDVLHPFEAPPLGDITPAEAKALARGRICLEGNIQIADMYEKSPENVRHQTEALIEACFDDRRGLIVCPTASPYIRGKGEEAFPVFKAMVDAVLEWKPAG